MALKCHRYIAMKFSKHGITKMRASLWENIAMKFSKHGITKMRASLWEIKLVPCRREVKRIGGQPE
jgi:hypothetical protein